MSMALDIDFIVDKVQNAVMAKVNDRINTLERQISKLQAENQMLKSVIQNQAFIVNQLYISNSGAATLKQPTPTSQTSRVSIFGSTTMSKMGNATTAGDSIYGVLPAAPITTGHHATGTGSSHALPPKSEPQSQHLHTESGRKSVISNDSKLLIKQNEAKNVRFSDSEPSSSRIQTIDLDRELRPQMALVGEDSEDSNQDQQKTLRPNPNSVIKCGVSFVQEQKLVQTRFTLPEAVYLVKLFPNLENNPDFDILMTRVENGENLAFVVDSDCTISIIYDISLQNEDLRRNCVKLACDGSLIISHSSTLAGKTVFVSWQKHCKFVEVYKSACKNVIVRAPNVFDNVAVNNKGLESCFVESCKYIHFVEIGSENQAICAKVFASQGVEVRAEWDCE